MAVDDGIELQHLLPAAGTGGDAPQLLRLIPGAAEHAVIEEHLVAQAVFLRDTQQVLLDLRALGVVAAPVRILLEGVGIEMAGGVDGHAGVDVLQPGAAEIGVLFDDREVVAGLVELDARGDAAHAGADHGHLEVGGRLFAVRQFPARHRLFECHLVIEHRYLLRGDFLAHAHAHHPAHEFARQRPFQRGIRAREQFEQAFAQIRGQLLRNIGRLDREHRADARREALEVCRVLRVLHVDHQQGGHVGVRERLPESLPIGDR